MRYQPLWSPSTDPSAQRYKTSHNSRGVGGLYSCITGEPGNPSQTWPLTADLPTFTDWTLGDPQHLPQRPPGAAEPRTQRSGCRAAARHGGYNFTRWYKHNSIINNDILLYALSRTINSVYCSVTQPCQTPQPRGNLSAAAAAPSSPPPARRSPHLVGPPHGPGGRVVVEHVGGVDPLLVGRRGGSGQQRGAQQQGRQQRGPAAPHGARTAPQPRSRPPPQAALLARLPAAPPAPGPPRSASARPSRGPAAPVPPPPRARPRPEARPRPSGPGRRCPRHGGGPWGGGAAPAALPNGAPPVIKRLKTKYGHTRQAQLGGRGWRNAYWLANAGF